MNNNNNNNTNTNKNVWFQVKPFYRRSKSFASPCNHTVPFHQPLNLKPANTTWTTVTISIDVVSTRVAGSFQEESSWPIEASIRGTRRLINGMRQAKNWSRISGWHRLYPGWLTSVLDYSSGTTFDRDTSRGGMATFIFWCTSAIPCATSSLTTSPRSKWKTTVAAFDLPAKVSIWIRGERRQGRICIILHRETRIPCNGSIGNRNYGLSRVDGLSRRIRATKFVRGIWKKLKNGNEIFLSWKEGIVLIE